eukprot:g321.t1
MRASKTNAISESKIGKSVWILNPYGSDEPIRRSDEIEKIGEGAQDSDPESKYREGWCPSAFSQRPTYVPAVITNMDEARRVYEITTALEPPLTISVPIDSRLMYRGSSPGVGFDECLNIEHNNLAEILWNIQKRFTRDQPYTLNAPNVVISVNPNKQIHLGNVVGNADPWRSLKREMSKRGHSEILHRSTDIDLFNYAIQKTYASSMSTSSSLPPHLYSVAKNAIQKVTVERIKSQIIVLSGIPGSGKTTNCKALLDFIITSTSKGGSSRKGSPDFDENRYDTTDLSKQERQALATQAVFDSFGSCATSRNSRSSRLGKVIKIHFTAARDDTTMGAEESDDELQSTIACVQVASAILDRSRLTSFPMLPGEERNYNVFYQLLTSGYLSLNTSILSRYAQVLYGKDVDFVGFSDSASNEHKVSGVNDKAGFDTLLGALAEFDITEEEQREIFEVVAGIIYFSEVTFMGYDDPKERVTLSVVHDSTRPCLKEAAKFWGLSVDALEETLCSRLKNDKTFVPIDVSLARKKQQMIIASIYGNLVEYIISRMNEAMLRSSPPGFELEESNYIGLVDLYGVDNQTKGFNSLDQMMMNYTAEKVQQILVKKFFKEEEELCREQEVTIRDLSYTDNVDRLEFFDKRATGLLSVVSNDSRFEKVTDAACLLSFIRGRKKQNDIWKKPNFEDFVDDKDGEKQCEIEKALCKTSLIVKHFTGDEVRYNFDGFLHTNKTFYAFSRVLGSPLEECFPQTTNQILRDGIVPRMNLNGLSSRHDLISNYKKILRERILTRGIVIRGDDRRALSMMENEITDSSFFDMHYVFCLRPNFSKSLTNHACPALLRRQIVSMSIHDIIKHRIDGFVYRKDYLTFIQRFLPIVANNKFLCLTAVSNSPVTKRELARELIRVMMQKKNMYIEDHEDQFELGKSMIFIRYTLFSVLNKFRETWDKQCYEAASIIQKCWHKFLARRRFQEMNLGIERVQASFRSSLSVAAWLKKERAASVIDNCFKNHVIRSHFNDRRVAALKTQKYYRIKRHRMKWLRIRRGIRIMHSLARGFVVRQHVLRMLRAVITIQRAVRAFQIRYRGYWKKVSCALSIQKRVRGHAWREAHPDVVGYLRAQVKKRKKATCAKVISSMYKIIVVRRRYREIREAAMCIQHWCRAVIVRNRYVKLRCIGRHLCRVIRGYNVRRAVDKMRAHNMVEDELWKLNVVRDRESKQLESFRESCTLNSAMSSYNLVDVDTLVNTAEFYPQGWTKQAAWLANRVDETGSRIVQTRVGSSHTVALNDRGEIYSWGWGDYGQLGHGDGAHEVIPRFIASISSTGALGRGIAVKHISCGDDHTVALSTDGRVYAWGSNLRGQLGIGVQERAVYAPSHIGRIQRKVTQVECGAYHTVALLASGLVYTWGSGAQLGLGVFSGRGDRGTPCNVKKLARTRVRNISCGPSFTAAVTHDGEVHMWGLGSDGQLGNGDRRPRFLPTPVSRLNGADRHRRVTSVQCGGHHCAALTSTGKVYTWGSSISDSKNTGCLGLGTVTQSLVPSLVTPMRPYRAVQVYCGWRMTVAMTNDHRVFAWGVLDPNARVKTNRSTLSFADRMSTIPVEVKVHDGAKALSLDVAFSHTISIFGVVSRAVGPLSSSSMLAQGREEVTKAHVGSENLSLVEAVRRNPELSRVNIKHNAFKKVKRLVQDFKGLVRPVHIDPNAAWMSLACVDVAAAQARYQKRTGRPARIWTLSKEISGRGIEVIRSDHESPAAEYNESNEQRIVVALIPVDRMSSKQLRSVVTQLQTDDEDAADSSRYADTKRASPSYRWRPSNRPVSNDTSSQSKKKRWNSSTTTTSSSSLPKKAYAPKMYRSPPLSNNVPTLSSELQSRSDFLRESMLENPRVPSLFGASSGSVRTSPPPPPPSPLDESIADRLQSTRRKWNYDRESERRRVEHTDEVVNWKNMSRLFDENHHGASARVGMEKGDDFRGMTVSDMVHRSTDRLPLFTEKHRKPIPKSNVRHDDSLMQGNATWSGIASLTSLSNEERRRVLGEGERARFEVHARPSSSKQTKPTQSMEDLKSKVDTLKQKLSTAQLRTSDVFVPPPTTGVPAAPDTDMDGVNSLLEKIKHEAASEIEAFWDSQFGDLEK